jgi:choline transport protein
MTTAAWIFTAATGPASLANLVMGLAIFNNDTYAPKRWQTAMVSWLFLILQLLFNLWFRQLLYTLEVIGSVIHVAFFFIFIITLTVMAEKSSNAFVFHTLTHDVSGWTNPVVGFGLGLLTMTFPVTGRLERLIICISEKQVS